MAAPGATDEIDIAARATIAYSSEDLAHPIENLLDERSGPGGSRWTSARPDIIERIVVEFDQPQTISRLDYEVEETIRDRTQEVRVEVSTMEVGRIARFWFRNTISVPTEPSFSAKNRALISTA